MAKKGSLAVLERQLAEVNRLRDRIIGNMKATVAGLTAGVTHFVESGRKEPKPARKAKRRISKAAREKLSAAAKKRWAEAKKAGKTKLG